MFFDDIARELGGFRNDVFDALWQLVWAGHVTNDTLAPLRARRRGTAAVARQRAGGAAAAIGGSFARGGTARLPGAEGRWSLHRTTATRRTRSLTAAADGASPSSSSAATACWCVRRSAARLVEGGFAALYPILRAMEEAGRVRRGYFVAGMGGAQFAVAGSRRDAAPRKPPGRDARRRRRRARRSDPANAYGSILKWPATRVENMQPQRGGGARVFLLDGELIGYLGRTGNHLLTFPPEDPGRRAGCGTRSWRRAGALAKRGSPVLIGQIDGAPRPACRRSPPISLRHGFAPTSRGLLHRGEEHYAAHR